MRIAFDTNVLAYSEGSDDLERQSRATVVIQALRRHDFILPVQVCAELHRYLTGKMRLARSAAGDIVRGWLELMPIHAPTSPAALEHAIGLAEGHNFQIFDALILAASAEAGARLLLSEDMQDGFVWRGVTIANPFGTTPHPLLADLLRG